MPEPKLPQRPGKVLIDKTCANIGWLNAREE
jgi:hypothetical protein